MSNKKANYEKGIILRLAAQHRYRRPHSCRREQSDRSLEILDSEVLLQHLPAVEASCERNVLFDVRCDISYREVLDSQIDIFDSLSECTSR